MRVREWGFIGRHLLSSGVSRPRLHRGYDGLDSNPENKYYNTCLKVDSGNVFDGLERSPHDKHYNSCLNSIPRRYLAASRAVQVTSTTILDLITTLGMYLMALRVVQGTSTTNLDFTTTEGKYLAV